jgi:hypothetical protein
MTARQMASFETKLLPPQSAPESGIFTHEDMSLGKWMAVDQKAEQPLITAPPAGAFKRTPPRLVPRVCLLRDINCATRE